MGRTYSHLLATSPQNVIEFVVMWVAGASSVGELDACDPQRCAKLPARKLSAKGFTDVAWLGTPNPTLEPTPLDTGSHPIHLDSSRPTYQSHSAYSFAISNPNMVAYPDATGAGCETISNVYKHGVVPVIVQVTTHHETVLQSTCLRVA